MAPVLATAPPRVAVVRQSRVARSAAWERVPARKARAAPARKRNNAVAATSTWASIVGTGVRRPTGAPELTSTRIGDATATEPTIAQGWTSIVDTEAVVGTSMSMCGAMAIRLVAARRFYAATSSASPADLFLAAPQKGRRLPTRHPTV